MRKEQRLRKPADFAAVHSGGRAWRHPLLIVRARANGLAHTRCGISVSRRLGNAVVRNRVKRLIRESVRQEETDTGWDVVIVAREACREAGFRQISEAVGQVFRQAGLYKGAAQADTKR